MEGILFIITGLVSAAYGILVLSIIGTGGWFNFFFLLLGLILAAVGSVMRRRNSEKEKGKFMYGLIVTAAVMTLVFIVIEAAILLYPAFPASPGADYVILLGTQLKDDGPSVEYRARLMSAYEYLTENPGSILVATGGKGDDEPKSEAEGAKEFLAALGIPEERILTENESTNTYQNIENAYRIISEREGNRSPGPVVIVSSSFHLFRARLIAKKVGFGKVSAKGCVGNRYLLPHFYMREFFAFVKDLLFR